jgi:dTDP-4-dehydrorhamnose reductase
MNSVLIVGVESIAGAGLASALSSTHRVTGLSSVTSVEIANCRTLHLSLTSATTIEQQIQSVSPARIVFCGKASRSSWDRGPVVDGFDDGLAVEWARAAARHGVDFVFVSSDSVFTGPWMSHAEDDEHFSSHEDSVRLLEIEAAIQDVLPDSLIVRTNVFGWSPCGKKTGFAEQLLAEIDGGLVERVDFVRHASPVLATDLGVLVEKAIQAEVCGILHLGGAERLSTYQFAERLSAAAGQSAAIIPDELSLNRLSNGRDREETTLDCSVARELLGVSMPLIEDGLSSFLAERPSRPERAGEVPVKRASVAGVA